MSEERLMKTPEEVRQKAKELLQMPKEEVLTKYMFQEQEIERLKELCDKYEEEHKTTFETWQKDIKENEHLRTALNTKESIIKEVKEHLKESINDYLKDDRNIDGTCNVMCYETIKKRYLKPVLEILDKENK